MCMHRSNVCVSALHLFIECLLLRMSHETVMWHTIKCTVNNWSRFNEDNNVVLNFFGLPSVLYCSKLNLVIGCDGKRIFYYSSFSRLIMIRSFVRSFTIQTKHFRYRPSCSVMDYSFSHILTTTLLATIFTSKHCTYSKIRACSFQFLNGRRFFSYLTKYTVSIPL